VPPVTAPTRSGNHSYALGFVALAALAFARLAVLGGVRGRRT
jgi:hypothetical protein